MDSSGPGKSRNTGRASDQGSDFLSTPWYALSGRQEAKERPARLGLLDMGSNSVRLVIYEPRFPWPRVFFNEKTTAALGHGLAATGRLDPKNQAIALDALKRFSALTKAAGVERVDAVATAAVRDAENGAAFVAQAEKVFGHPIKIAPGPQEALWGIKGVIAGAPEADGIFADMGGGSLQVGLIDPLETAERQSFPLGALRLMEQCQGDTQKAAAAIRKRLRRLAWLDRGKGKTLYLVGGAWRALALTHMHDTDYPLHMVHGYNLKVDKVLPWLTMLKDASDKQLKALPIRQERRRPTLPTAAAGLLELISASDVSRIQFSAFGIRQGIMFDQVFDERIWSRPEQLYHCAATSLFREGNRYGEDVREALLNWVPWKIIDDGVPSAAAKETALIMSDAGWDYHTERRASDVVLDVLHTQDLPLSHKDRVFVALALTTRHGGDYQETLSARLLHLLREREIKAARTLGLVLRFAYKCSGASLAILQNSRLTIASDTLELSINSTIQSLATRGLHDSLAKLCKRLGMAKYHLHIKK